MLTLILLLVCAIQTAIIVYLLVKKHTYDGSMVITRRPDGKKIIALELSEDPNNIEEKDEIVFKVRNEITPDFD